MKVLTVGLTSIDIINICQYFPEEDEDVNVISQRWSKGGNAANTACVLAQFKNVEVHLLSCLSYRKECGFVLEQLKEFGVNVDHCPLIHEHYFPTSSCIINSQNGSRTILHCPNNFPSLKYEDFCKIDIHSFDLIHFEGRNFPEVGKMIDHVLKIRGANKKPLLSGEMEKLKRYEDLQKYLLKKVDILFVGKDIARSESCKNPLEAVKYFSSINDLTAKYVICPWGELGAASAENCPQNNSYTYHQCEATRLDKVVDTLGAGDTFIAGTLYTILMNQDIKSVLQFSCELAGRKCKQNGFKNLIQEC